MTEIRKFLAERTGRWDKLVQSSPALEAELPHLAESAEITRKLRERLRAGDRLRGRIGASLRGRFGFDSPSLSRYGFKPRRHRDAGPKAPMPKIKAETESPPEE